MSSNLTPHPPNQRRSLLRLAANTLSLSRICIGVVAYLALSGARDAGLAPPPAGAATALALVLAAALTDYLDGVMARRAGANTAPSSADWFGRWIDAFTDFFLFLCVYGALLRAALVPAWLYALFLAREGVMYLMFRPAALRLGLDHGARRPGKIKTVLQYAGVIGLLALLALASHLGLSTGTVRSVAAGTVAVLVAVSLASLYWYLRPLFLSWPQPQRGLPPAALCRAAGPHPCCSYCCFTRWPPTAHPGARFWSARSCFTPRSADSCSGATGSSHRSIPPVAGGPRASPCPTR